MSEARTRAAGPTAKGPTKPNDFFSLLELREVGPLLLELRVRLPAAACCWAPWPPPGGAWAVVLRAQRRRRVGEDLAITELGL